MKLFPCTPEISHFKVAEALLEEGIIMLRILRNRDGVTLPDFLNTPVVNLNFSYRFGISDFEVDEKGIRASLSFRGVPHFCDIPWSAVCAIISEKTDQAFAWINAFTKAELSQFVPPEALATMDDPEAFAVLDEFPELKPYVFDDKLKDANEEENEEDEDGDDIPPGGYTPLHFV